MNQDRQRNGCVYWALVIAITAPLIACCGPLSIGYISLVIESAQEDIARIDRELDKRIDRKGE